jgi:hypothetical protein
MLKRNSLLEKRKKKKADFDKVLNMAKSKIELDLKNQNKKSETDFVNLDELEVSKAKFVVAEDVRQLI